MLRGTAKAVPPNADGQGALTCCATYSQMPVASALARGYRVRQFTRTAPGASRESRELNAGGLAYIDAAANVARSPT
jgi:hypothetical protein